MRTIHDRYAPSKRNPYNEIEFSDFYARAMASYGSLIAISGFEYNGPERMIGFSPVVQPENFRVPFTAAEGWGTFSQQISKKKMTASIKPAWGSLSLKRVQLNPQGLKARAVAVTVGGKKVNATLGATSKGISVAFGAPVRVAAGQELIVELESETLTTRANQE